MNAQQSAQVSKLLETVYKEALEEQRKIIEDYLRTQKRLRDLRRSMAYMRTKEGRRDGA